jgi:hypothetical protein
MSGRGRLYKWVVSRNCTVGIYAKNFSKKISQSLSVTSIGIVSHGNIEFAIGSKVNGAAIMIGGCWEGVQLKDNSATAWQNHIAIGSEPNHTIVCGSPGNCVIEIHIMVEIKMWIEGNTQKPSLSGRVHGECHKGSGQ